MSASLREPLSLHEYETLSYGELSESEISHLERITKDLGLQVFRFFRAHAQAQQYVGMMKVGDRVVQILPKIYDKEEENLGFLVFMLSYTRRLRLRPTGTADYEKLNGSFLEVWIQHFATELNRLLKRHLVHRYMEIEERTSFLRGKLLVERELGGAGEIYARYACRYEIFTPDHLLNQTLKFCNFLLLGQTRVQENRMLLQQNDALLADVTYKLIRSEDLGRIHLDRLNRHYEPILGLCRLLLDRSTLDFRSGRITQLAFVFDMNDLFEGFVAEFLKRHAGDISLAEGNRLQSVSAKKNIGRLFEQLGMEPDLVLTDTTGKKFIVDTKYKRLSFGEKPSREDLYQMYAYVSAGKQRYNDIVLLYPKTIGIRDTLSQGEEIRLHVRQFDPRKVYNPESGNLDRPSMAKELSQALSFARSVD